MESWMENYANERGSDVGRLIARRLGVRRSRFCRVLLENYLAGRKRIRNNDRFEESDVSLGNTRFARL